MAFMLGKHLVFLDSFQFMSSSLDRLSANLPNDKFKHTSEVFKKEKLELMTQKASIHMTIWILLRDLMRPNCQVKMIFLAT